MLDATTTKKVATTTKKSYFIWLVGHIKYISSLPIYDLHPKFNFEVKLWFLFTCHIFILCVFIMSIQYFHKQEKRRKHLYNPKGYLPFNSCSCSLDRWGWLGCLDCGDAIGALVYGTGKETHIQEVPEAADWGSRWGPGGTCFVLGTILCVLYPHSLHHPFPHSFIHQVSTEHLWVLSTILAPGYSSEQSRQRFPPLWDSSGRNQQEMMSNRVGLMVINKGKRQRLGHGGLAVLRFPVGWSGRVLQRRDQKERFHCITHVLLV